MNKTTSEIFSAERTKFTLLQSEDLKTTLVRYLKFFFFIPEKKERVTQKIQNQIEQKQSKRYFLKKLLNPLSLSGLFIIAFFIFLGVYAPWLSPYSYEDLVVNIHPNAFASPSLAHPLGTTEYGRDVLGRLIWGARVSLTAGLSAIFISLSFGIIFGLIAAYFGGFIDNLLMRIFDVIMSFPGLILVMIFIGILGNSIDNVLFAFGILGIPGTARFFRASVLQIKQNLYIESAETSGAQDFKIMFRHIFPNAISPLIISTSYSLGGIILGMAAISFLGLGEEQSLQWGQDINVGALRLFTAPWAVLWPGLFIALAVLGFMLIGDGLRDALDPKNQE